MSDSPKKAFGDKKLPLWHVPTFAVQCIALALWQGVLKYGAFNWRTKPVDACTYISAMRRHLDAYADGEDFAPDGTHHLAHVAASCAILLDAGNTSTADGGRALIDNRVKRSAADCKRADDFIANQLLAIQRRTEAWRIEQGITSE